MRQRGFELFDLSINRYSTSALPSRYLQANPSKTEIGRPFQGDALYIRDIASEELEDFCAAMTPERLLKAAAIFSLYGLPDCAAEILTKFRGRLEAAADIGHLLDVLAAQIQLGRNSSLSYVDYLAKHAADDPTFYAAQTCAAAKCDDETSQLRTRISELEQEVGRLAATRRSNNGSWVAFVKNFLARRQG